MTTRFRVAAAALVAALVATAGLAGAPATAAPAADRTLVSSGVPAVTPGAPSPAGVKAPKGMRPADGSKDVGRVGARAACPGTPNLCMMYSGASEFLGGTDYTSGMAANLHVYPTYLNSADYHTLSEIAVQSGNTGAGLGNVVEVGFTVDPTLNGGSSAPHLFVFWWKNGVGQCYNGCGFVPYAPTCSVAANYCAGESLAPLYTPSGNGDPKRVQISRSGSAWWVAFDLKWIGYFPDTLWTAATPSGPGVSFTQGKLMQGFTEVAAFTTTPCTDMGNGFPSSHGSAARVGTVGYITPVSPAGLTPNLAAGGTYAPYPAPNILSATTSRHGGPGTGGVKDGC